MMREPRRQITKQVDVAMRLWGLEVAKAATAFEARWTRHALRKYDPQLANHFEAQLERFALAMDSGTSIEIDEQGSRLCRAYAVAATKLDSVAAPDDAYLIGCDPQTGLSIGIGVHPSSASRIRQVHGDAVAWFSPDEIATLIALNDRLKKLVEVKLAFPAAEITTVHRQKIGRDQFIADAIAEDDDVDE